MGSSPEASCQGPVDHQRYQVGHRQAQMADRGVAEISYVDHRVEYAGTTEDLGSRDPCRSAEPASSHPRMGERYGVLCRRLIRRLGHWGWHPELFASFPSRKSYSHRRRTQQPHELRIPRHLPIGCLPRPPVRQTCQKVRSIGSGQLRVYCVMSRSHRLTRKPSRTLDMSPVFNFMDLTLCLTPSPRRSLKLPLPSPLLGVGI